MASILKVDTLQKPDGSAPTAADLGIDVAGSVVQVVQVTKAANATVSSTSYIDVGLEVTITPKYANSKFLVVLSMSMASGTAGTGKFIRLYRNGTNIGNGGSGSGGEAVAMGDYCPSHGNSQAQNAYSYLDSPATSSTLTYKAMSRTSNSSSVVYINRANGLGAGYAEPLSSITVYEIAQ